MVSFAGRGIGCACTITAMAIGAFVTAARGDVVVIPSSVALAGGNGQTNTPVRDAGNPRTLQLIIGRQHLAGVPTGSLLTGIDVRAKADGAAAWPGAPLTFDNFSVTIATAALQATNFSTTLSSNALSDGVTVFTGTVALAPGALPGGAPANGFNDFGPLVNFTTPFKWDGQDIAITIRHNGSSAAGDTRFLDALTNAHASYGVGGLAALSAVGSAATVGSGSPFPIIRLRYAAPTQPTTLTAPVTRSGRPGNMETTELLGGTAQTFVSIINNEMLSRLPAGSDVSAMALRLAPGKASWPASAAWASFAQFDLSLGPAAMAAQSMSNVFAQNFAASENLVLVRSGALTAPPASLANEDQALQQPATLLIPFATNYVHVGGNVAMKVVHAASSIQGAGPHLDALAVTINGIASRRSEGLTPANGIAALTPVVDFHAWPATVIPTDRVATLGNAQSIEFFSAAPGTFQMVLAGEALSAIPRGALIDGLNFRGVGATVFPSKTIVLPRFEIYAAKARTSPSTMVQGITSNARHELSLVRSGSLAINLNAYAISGPPARRWGPTIRFDRPIVYTGEPILLVFRHSGVGADAGAFRFDCVAPAALIGKAGHALGADVFETNISSAMPILRLHYRTPLAAPSAAAETPGDASDTSLMSPNETTMQWLIRSTELPQMMVGSPIASLAFRLAPGASDGPPIDALFSRFDVTIGPAAVRSGEQRAEFDANHAAGAVPVRRGALTIPAYAGRVALEYGAPAAPTIIVPLQRSYVWEGGDLAITVRTSGWTFAKPLSIDAVEAGSPLAADRVSVIAGDGAGATSGWSSAAPVMMLMAAKPARWRSGDIADDQGNAPPLAGIPNGGINQADYNAFFTHYFAASAQADIADDAGKPLPSENPNGGVNEGDYNYFFRIFFEG